MKITNSLHNHKASKVAEWVNKSCGLNHNNAIH